jgi:hypothetical protein
MIFDFIEKARGTYLYLRWSEIKHRFTCGKRGILMAKGMERFRACDNRKSKSQINKEMSLCHKYWRCYPMHYYRYDLYRKDKDLSETELLNYIPEFFFYTLFLPFYDSDKYEILLTDKIITEQLFRSLEISQPHTICKLFNNHIYTNEFKELSFNTVQKELISNEYSKLFVKPVNGQGGYGMYIFNRDHNGKYFTKNKDEFNEEFLNKIGSMNDYIIQPGLEQDHEIAKIYPHSINTCRIATENINGNIRVLCATLRMGRGGMQIDNGSQGGVILKIDVDTGNLSDYFTTEQSEYFDKHPDTNFDPKNSTISNWNEVKQFVTESARKLLQFTYLGWDIALTTNGPSAIETNLCFGLDHFQVPMGGLREIFRIDDPLFYWKNRGEKFRES